MLQELTLEFLKDCTFCATAQNVSYSAAISACEVLWGCDGHGINPLCSIF